ncbi:MAG TPA: thioredoxin family protein [Burkholderiaceae bacterium]|nr:thioredoxin family protein [Burkholderiaceae bacterium]
MRSIRSFLQTYLSLALCYGLALALAATCRAAVPTDPTEQFVSAELLSEQDAISPGATFWVGLHLRHAPHWHTYWAMPGDAGLPTRLRWDLEPGYRPGPIQWPVPQRLRVGDLANYGYEGDVLLPVSLQAPGSAQIGSNAHIKAHADWLVCSDICIPGGAELSVALPIRAPGDVHPGPAALAFATARRQVPMPMVLQNARATIEAGRIELEFSSSKDAPHTLEFFPLEANQIVAAADQVLSVRGNRVRLELQAQRPTEPDFKALHGVLVADGGPSARGWAAPIDVAMSPLSKGAQTPVAVAVESQRAGATPPPGLSAPASSQAAAATSAAAARQAASAPPPVFSSTLALAIALAGAFVGGVILNLMPCVFPVLSLKLIGLVRHRDEPHAALRAHGVAFAIGAVLSFLGLAALLIALRAAGSQIGWGFQLQSSLFIAALIGLFFLIGLNLLGTFEFTFGAGLANSRAADWLDGEGPRGSFATGVLAAVVASPCTAPFMGAALGFAVTQPAPIALAVFAMLGLGMATPYLLLTMIPSWLGRLPRAGTWMERLRQLMAFPMFLTCVWLFWVLAQQRDADTVAWVLMALVGWALFAWSAGMAQRGARGFRWLAGAAALLAILTMVPLAQSGTNEPLRASLAVVGEDWAAWSQEEQREALARGSPIFVDFTAAWCITCQANKRLVLHNDQVQQAFQQHGVVLMRADWTRRDEAIARELARFARSGVPMYVLYDRKGNAHLLPEILSTKIVLDELGSI